MEWKRTADLWKRAPRLAAAGLAAAVITGCGSGAGTQEAIVAPKEMQQETQPEMQQEAAAGGIQEQVQAPDKWQESVGEGAVTVAVDATVIVPEAEGFRTKKVKSRVFTQEDYDTVNRVLLGGGRLWDRDMEEMSGSNGFTRPEIEERLARLKEDMASGTKEGGYGGKDIGYEEAIAEFERMLEQAPEKAVITEIPPIVSFNEGEGQQESNMLYGNVTAGGQDYFVMVNNSQWEKDFRYLIFSVTRNDIKGNFLGGRDIEKKKNELSVSIDEIRNRAVEMVKQMGLEEYAPAGEEYLATYAGDEEHNGEITQANLGYGIHFTRMIDGIPVTYTYQDGGTAKESEDPIWNYEALTLVYDEKGLADFQWVNPYVVEDESEDYVFLLPFTDIQNIFREMVLKKYEDRFEEEGWKVELKIDEARLGYMRIMDKDNPEEGKLIPVWDFMGSQEITSPNETEKTVTGGPYECLFTINAMDGTVIDKDLGY